MSRSLYAAVEQGIRPPTTAEADALAVALRAPADRGRAALPTRPDAVSQQ